MRRFILHSRLLWLVCLPILSEVATFGATHTLTVNINGSGTVSRNPTNSTYPDGVVVTLTANPASGWLFDAWSGDATGNTNPLNLLMDGDKVVTANFLPIPSYTLTTSVAGQGAVSLDPTGGTYLSNSLVSVTAVPDAGWVFVHWSGADSTSNNPISVTVDANKSVTAEFAQLPVIDVPPQDQSAGLGDTVTFNAHAAGTGPLHYQWRFNDSDLPWATNAMLTLTNVQSDQEGVYALTVTNDYGSDAKSAYLAITNACEGTNVVTAASEQELRAAIAIGGNIRLCFNGTVTLTNTIDITHDVILDAHNRTVVISGNNAVRLFNVNSGVTFGATNIVFANGRDVGENGADAGGQPAQPGLPGEGGAILNDGGNVILVSCLLSNNSVVGGMGGTAAYPYPDNGAGGEGLGGAILNRGGLLQLYSVRLLGNWASGAAGVPITTGYGPDVPGNAMGGAIYSTNGSVTLADCSLVSNYCFAPFGGLGGIARGGGIFQVGGSVVISNSILTTNTARGGDSTTYPRPSSGYGGAIAQIGGTLAVVHCQVAANVARGGDAYRNSGTGEAQGGALYSSGTFSVSDSSFEGNWAVSGSYSSINTDGRGGGIFNAGTGVVERCCFSMNKALGGNAGAFGAPSVDYPGGHGLGGAVCNTVQMAMTNCTIALNSARGGNGGNPYGVPGSGLGGGVFNTNGVLTVMNSTVASNTVVSGVGYVYQGTAAGANVANTNGVISFCNSIVAYGGTNGNAWGPISDGGFNISSDGSANFSGGSSFNFTDPRLGGLGANGGPTLTMALLGNSPAVDLGTAAGAPATDQRGYFRPAGAGVDVGAYELNALPSQDLLVIRAMENGLELDFAVKTNAAYHLQSSANFASWDDVGVFGPFANPTNVVYVVHPGSEPCRYFRLYIP